MDRYTAHKDISKKLKCFNKWQLIAFCGTAAARMSPAFLNFGSLNSQKLFRKGLDIIWRAIAGKKVADEALKMRKSLESLPEFDIEDYDLKEFAMYALHILMFSLEACKGGSHERAKWACEKSMDLVSCFDFELKEGGSEKGEIYDSQKVPLGKLESREVSNQNDVIEYLASIEKPNEETTKFLENLSKKAADKLVPVILKVTKVKEKQ